ncbi:MAG: DUF4367 domain-containing protein, partial [Neglectibacter timonensis]
RVKDLFCITVFGRQIQHEKAREEENKSASKPGSGRKRFFRRLAGVAAVVVIVAAVGITGVGGPDRMREVVQRIFGGRETIRVNSDDKEVLYDGEDQEEAAYQEIKDVLGIDPVRLIKRLPYMEFMDMQLDPDLRVADVFYNNEGEIVSYIINCSQEDAAWGADIEDTLIQEYNYPLNSVQVLIQEYMIEENGEKKYSAQFEYQEVHYQLTGIMTREQMEEILNNLYFL